MKDWVSLTAMLLLVSIPIVSCTSAESGKKKPLSGIKLICVWTVEAENQEAVDQSVDQARSLGFNAVCWDRPSVVASCRQHGMKAFALINPLDRREGAQLQVLKPGEEKLPGFDSNDIPPEQFYQYGGEPVAGKREILDQNFTCPNDPGILEYTLKRVAEMQKRGYDGIIWDFLGYRNYRSCECEMCRMKLEEFREKQPDMTEQETKDNFYEKVLVDLYNTLYRETKTMAPNLIIANHIHPVFLPNIFYGHRVKVDYCGITVSWFFKPRWPLEKVRDYTKKAVSGPYLHEDVIGMPMIGFYSDGKYARDRRSARRLEQEFEILKESDARHLIMCELGHILRDKEASRVIMEELRNN